MTKQDARCHASGVRSSSRGPISLKYPRGEGGVGAASFVWDVGRISLDAGNDEEGEDAKSPIAVVLLSPSAVNAAVAKAWDEEDEVEDEEAKCRGFVLFLCPSSPLMILSMFLLLFRLLEWW